MPMENDKDDIYLLDGRVRLYPPAVGGFRPSLDSVMLAAACRAEAGSHILDMGCGVGSAGLCVLARVPETRITGVDIQPDLVDIAQTNADLNGWSERATYICTDVHDLTGSHIYDHVICNPPYLDAGTYTPSPDVGRARALGHLEDDVGIEDWITMAHTQVKSKGTVTIIHRADYVARIIQGMGKRFGGIEMIPLWPRAGIEAKRVIVRATKDRRDPARVLPGVVLHEADGSWTQAAEAVLRGMAAI